MPTSTQLPEQLKPLARRHAATITHVGFGAEADSLVELVRRVTEGDDVA
jgi:hypothetical protein